MSTVTLKNKIYKSLEEMDTAHLQSAYQIFKEFANQQKYANIKVEKDIVEKKIAKGVKQLDNGEGSDFRLFLKEVNKNYVLNNCS